MVRDVKKYKKDLPKVNFTDKFDEIVNDSDTLIVVELMGGENPAKDYISKLLKSGQLPTQAKRSWSEFEC